MGHLSRFIRSRLICPVFIVYDIRYSDIVFMIALKAASALSVSLEGIVFAMLKVEPYLPTRVITTKLDVPSYPQYAVMPIHSPFFSCRPFNLLLLNGLYHFDVVHGH
jgi:hypothetical protein